MGLLAGATVMTLAGLVVASPPRPAGAPVAVASAPTGTAYKELTWANLMPMGWDPMKKFREMNLGRLSDNSPGMGQMMLDLREALDNAPLIGTFDGTPVRIAGYVVPLQTDRDGLKEFLLVPYFGACIHMPPPPANQILWVKLSKGNRSLRAMDTVWAQGVMQVERQSSEMGVSGYQLTDASTEPYVGRQR